MKSLIVILIVGMAIVYLEKIAKGNYKEGTEKKYIMRLPLICFWIGAAANVLFAVLLIYFDFSGQYQEYPFSLIGLAGISLLGFYTIALTLPGVWEIRVDEFNIEMIKCLVYKKNFSFSDIEKCIVTSGGIEVYIRGKKKKAFFVDKLMTGANAFYKQLRAVGIPIENQIGKEVER